MRPPCCALCDEDFFPPEGGLVTFAPTTSDEAWHARAEAEHLVGHPPNQEWFCATHLEAARALADHSLDDAMATLRASMPARRPRDPAVAPPKKRPTSPPATTLAPSAEPAPANPTVPKPRPTSEPHPLRERMKTLPAPTLVTVTGRRVDALFRELRDLLPDLAACLDADVPADLPLQTRKEWTPMDGAGPPWCPWVDHGWVQHADDQVEIRLSWSRACWNEHQVSNVNLSCSVRTAEGSVYIGAGARGDPRLSELRLRVKRIDVGPVEALLKRLGA